MRGTGLRIGKVSGIDYENGMMQVVYTDRADAVTASMPYANYNNEYCMPEIGESVLVAHLSNGSSRGVVLSTIWNRKNVPPECGKGLYRKELSKKAGAAYVRFGEDEGEYLIRVPVILLHGVERTDLEGPEVNIAANLRTSLESPEHTASVGKAVLKGLGGEGIGVEVADDVRVDMSLAQLDALIRGIVLETMEGLEARAGGSMRVSAAEGMEMASGSDMRMAAGRDAGLSAGKDIRLEDGRFATTLSSVMERLEALDGDRSARKQEGKW